MTVCYLIQTHRDPEQILRLVRTIRAGSRGPIVVWHDFGKCALDPSPLTAFPDVRVVAARPTVRATFSAQAGPYLEALSWMAREGIDYQWLVNISGQDYPVMPLPRIEAALAASPADGYIRHWDVFSPASPWPPRKARKRYWYRYWRLPERAEPWLRATRFLTRMTPVHYYLDYGPLLGVRRIRTPFSGRFRCHGGWAFFTLRRTAVRYLLSFLAEHPDVEAHYRTTVAAEESLVPTILANSDLALVDDSLRYIDYARAVRGSPRTLTAADLPELTSGRYHFARKFDPAVDVEVLDRLDAYLGAD